jgi:hypothetical protein
VGPTRRVTIASALNSLSSAPWTVTSIAMTSPEQLTRLDLTGVAITAGITTAGELTPIEGVFDKLLAAAQKRSLARIHTVVVAHGQNLSGILLVRDPHGAGWYDRSIDLLVLPAHTLDEAITLFGVDAASRWGAIIDCRDELERHRDFVGREWLNARLAAFVARRNALGRRGGYFVITGAGGTGKSAFVADGVRGDPSAIYHFIRRGRDDPRTFFRSLTAQLLRRAPASVAAQIKVLLTRPAADEDEAAKDFIVALEHVSGALEHDSWQFVWLDGLDEAYGPLSQVTPGHSAGRRSLPPALNQLLPKGIVVVMTSQPGDQLNSLADPALAEIVHIESETTEDDESDVHKYLIARNETENLGLSSEFIKEAVERCDNNFLYAVLLVQDLRTLQPTERTASLLPKGLQGYLVKRLESIVTRWAELNSS